MFMKFDRSFVAVNGVEVTITRREAMRLNKEAGFTFNAQGSTLEVIPPVIEEPAYTTPLENQ